MNRNFTLLFILLATLSMVNAIPHQLYKRGINWGPCPPLPNAESFSRLEIFADSSVAYSGYGGDPCGAQALNCPVNPGTYFMTHASMNVPSNLPDYIPYRDFNVRSQ
ncbi:5206_t:CDS:2 [Ambispora gerdemannii]|uniref:5206_t:CDS:1 n=1 Tax=Ambispora gerdemannii TaxID=144530 RepID=A0A9N9B275_9GLOM|nr:5206_t:CDS:2 [Ambispora gerdemannii]